MPPAVKLRARRATLYACGTGTAPCVANQQRPSWPLWRPCGRPHLLCPRARVRVGCHPSACVSCAAMGVCRERATCRCCAWPQLRVCAPAYGCERWLCLRRRVVKVWAAHLCSMSCSKRRPWGCLWPCARRSARCTRAPGCSPWGVCMACSCSCLRTSLCRRLQRMCIQGVRSLLCKWSTLHCSVRVHIKVGCRCLASLCARYCSNAPVCCVHLTGRSSPRVHRLVKVSLGSRRRMCPVLCNCCDQVHKPLCVWMPTRLGVRTHKRPLCASLVLGGAAMPHGPRICPPLYCPAWTEFLRVRSCVQAALCRGDGIG